MWREGQEGHTAGAVPGPRPCSDADFGLSPACEQRHPPETKLIVEEFAVAEEVIKGDLQKADNAAVPDNLWLRAIVLGSGKLGCLAHHLGALGRTEGTAGFPGGPTPPMGWQGALPGLRWFALRYWRSLVTRGYISWCRANLPLPAAPSGEGQLQLVLYHWEGWQGVGYPVYEWSATGRRRYQTKWRLTRASADGQATVEVGHDAIHRCADATWFEWPKGSAPLFWNWGPEYQREVQDGQPHFMTGTLATPFMRKQAKARDPLKHELMRAKVVQVRQRGYIKPGEVVSGTHYFCVHKGTSDTRMVYNGTSCGLNAQLHAPHYSLVTVKHTLRALREGYYQCDLDVGEQFLNYKLYEHMRGLSGVDVQEVRSSDPADKAWEAARKGNWERWERNWMGLQDSPCRSLQWQARLKLEVHGDRQQRANPFHWDRVVMNLPGSKGYWSDLPWVVKIWWDGELAAKVFVYVDDGRGTGPNEFLLWQAV